LDGGREGAEDGGREGAEDGGREGAEDGGRRERKRVGVRRRGRGRRRSEQGGVDSILLIAPALLDQNTSSFPFTTEGSTHHDVTSSSFSVITGPFAIVRERKRETEEEKSDAK